MAVELSTRELVVQQVNGSGFKSTDGDWWNISKFARATDVAMPHVGERVMVSLDKSGFVRRVEPVARPATPAPASVTPEAATGPIAPTIAQDDRGVVITRLACLNTATAILSSGTTLDEVLALAARLEVWATR